MYSFHSVEPLIIEYVIGMANTFRTCMNHKLLSVLEMLDIINEVDVT